MPDQLSRHLAAVMFTDMAGYTALMRRDEGAALIARQRHRQALEESLKGRFGEVLQYFGDGSLCIFSSTVHAVDAAMDIQARLEGDPALRIGLHAGEIAYDVQGAYGDAVNIAARLEALCPPGGVTISHKIYDDIRRHPRIEVVALGSVRLKGVEDAVPIYALALAGLVTQREVEDDTPPPAADDSATSLPRALLTRLDDLARRPDDPLQGVATVPGRIPLVGREREMEAIQGALIRAESGRAGAIFLRGPRGVGKTRLTQEVATVARDRGWTVLRGRAHPSGRLVPYSPFADALTPLLAGLDLETLGTLTPGDGAVLCDLFPALGTAPRRADPGATTPAESRARLYWQFAGFLARLSAHRPLLLVLEDLDFADRASLELLEVAARQSHRQRIVFVSEYAGTDPDRLTWLRGLEQSLLAEGIGRVFELEPFDEATTAVFIRHAFDLDDDDAARLARSVFMWSQGNPFFMTGTLRGLVAGGALKQESGQWRLADLEAMELPHSVRDAVLAWTGRLTERGLALARSLAIVGRQASYEVLREITELPDDELAPALDELVRHQLVLESESRWALVYAFRNPLLRDILRSGLPLATRRGLHARVARALEAYFGHAKNERADELAYHYCRAHDRGSARKAVHYLVVAGTSALARHANQEAVNYFTEALERLDAAPPNDGADAGGEGPPFDRVLRGLARARRRLGDTSGSLATWRRLLGRTGAASDGGHVARVELEVGYTLWAAGALEEAAEQFSAAASLATTAELIDLAVRAQLAEAVCLQYSGDPEGSGRLIEAGLRAAEQLDDPKVLGRVYRAQTQHHLWTGRIDEARKAAYAALALSRTTGDLGVEFWSQWALGALEGLIGNTVAMATHIDSAQALADAAGSPFLHVATQELAVELAYARGEWNEGLRMGHRAIDVARATDQRLVLPRLLVWVSLIHLARGELGEAESLIDEAWQISKAAGAERAAGFTDLHAVVPAHIGRASLHLARGEWDEATMVAQAGLGIADRSGYIVWAIHHILPIIGEAALHSRKLDKAHAIGVRMREEATRMGHPLGLAWADACDAILGWLQSDAAGGVRSLRKGVESMEAIPMTYEAARLRRQLAGRLADAGDADGALRELRLAYDVFARLEARPELEKARGQFGELGAAVPEQT